MTRAALNGHRGVSRRRLALFTLAIMGGFLAVCLQLVRLGLEGDNQVKTFAARAHEQVTARPDIVDRNGKLVATDVVVLSLFGNPQNIKEPDATVLTLSEYIPDVPVDELRQKLASSPKSFEWIKRGLTPAEAQVINDIGLRGLDFRREFKRFYPSLNVASQVVGTVRSDQVGTLGIESYIDARIGTDTVLPPARSPKPPVALSIDLRAQHALREELAAAIARFEARAAVGLVMDAKTGEMIAATSLPDFDPNQSIQTLDPERKNRMTFERYELGSVFKLLSTAAVIDAGIATPGTLFDATAPIEIGNATISDGNHAVNRPLSAEEVFIKSSNIGAARMAEALRPEGLRAFYDQLGLLDPATTELGEGAKPGLPERWDDLHAMTAAYGHGLSVAPVQFLAAAATVLNGGVPVTPTFLKLPVERLKYRRPPVLKPETSGVMRGLMRLNVTMGTGKRADVPGYKIGGKTGTADIPSKAGYLEDKVIASFVAAVPSDEPRYVMLISLFEPTANEASSFKRSASYNAAPTTANVLRRLAPILGLRPENVSQSAPNGTERNTTQGDG